ncbi:MAG: hypothetical protein ABEJ95_02725 [Candidatus Nanohalobium sp.]
MGGVSAQSSNDVVVQEFSWDMDGDPDDPGNYDQDDLQQWKSACGDDPNEYLVKEHIGNSVESETEDDHYACVDRPDDCVYNTTGSDRVRVFSEGETWNLGNDEAGSDPGDPEVCLDYDQSRSGGEWYDMDADHMTKDNLNSDQFNALERAQINALWGSNPGTDRGRAPTGYATEDDCDSGKCDDNGQGTSSSAWFNAGEFTEGAEQDNNDGVHNKMQDDSDQFESGATTEDNWDSIYSGTPWTDNEKDTAPGPDNWGLSSHLSDGISNTGESYAAGSCYTRTGVSSRTSTTDDTLLKTQKVFGNSYIQNQGGDGVWRDPDDLSWNLLSFSCDLTGSDRGIGINASTGTTTRNNDKEVRAPINFADGSVDEGFDQEQPVCGDDNKEYLIEGVGEAPNSEINNGNWGCAVDNDYCYTDQGQNFYKDGTYMDTDDKTEDEGRLKSDGELCIYKDSLVHGRWADQDYGDVDGDGVQDTCRENNLYGEQGVDWITSSYVQNNPNAVTGGIDDDWNGYLQQQHNNGEMSTVYTSKPDSSTWGSTESPVPTGTNNNSIDTLGFCGGDDSSEYLVYQNCQSGLCNTNTSIKGVANDPDKCVLEKSKVDGLTGNKRQLYDEGDKIEANGGSMACYDGTWFGSWPIKLYRDQVNTQLGGTENIGLKVINVENQASTFELELSTGSETLDTLTTFRSTGKDQITTEVPPKSSKTFNIEVKGNKKIENFKQLEVIAQSQDRSLTGSDTTEIKITENGGNQASTGTTTHNIPGLTTPYIILLTATATLLYHQTLT